MAKKQVSLDLADILLANKKITPDQLKQLQAEAAESGLNWEEVLRSSNLVKLEDIMAAKAQLFGMPYKDLVGHVIPIDVIKLIPQEIAENYQIVVFEQTGQEVSVALVNPGNYKAVEAAEYIARENKWHLHYYLTSAEGFISAVRQYESLTSEVTEALNLAGDKFQDKSKEKKSANEDNQEGNFEEIVKSAPVAKMVAVILRHAVEGGASDIHIEPNEDETRVRYRIDGDLHTSIVLPRYIHTAIVSRIKVLANLKIDETRIPQDGRIRLQVANRPIDLRVSTMPLLNSEKVVMRILDTTTGVKTLEELGFWGKTMGLLKESLSKSKGMLLVTGPTGSGKSTTLYAALNILNKEDVNIITLEDPIEYYLQGVNQSQINPEVEYTFSTGLRSILRQDPDVILVGEIRDTETAELAIHASLTGHVVLSTLHTNDASGAIPRLIDMHVEPFLISSTVNIIIAQRLVRKICTYCQEEIKVPEEMLIEMKKGLTNLPSDIEIKELNQPWVFKKGKGCNRCDFTGYKGRTVISEALVGTTSLQNLIVKPFTPNDIKEEYKKQGILSLKQDGLIKVLQGLTTLEEVLTVTKD
ncbi:Flp pilus assembly complex ATPase component TadA [Patescibacteria group bacterium]|nr:Flp pilus assembly complex ATPase component TadA [Patescibacteria group bacterium]